MEIKCPKCGTDFVVSKNDAWLLGRAMENRLNEIDIVCEVCNARFKINPINLIPISIPDNSEQSTYNPDTFKYRYRCEQTTITKLNGVIISHGVTKQEYLISKHSFKNGSKYIDVEMLDNFIQFEPQQLQMAIKLLTDVDMIKSNVSLIPNNQTGRIKSIHDKAKILNGWDDFKNNISKNYTFLKNNNEWQQMDIFIDTVEKQINDDNLLIADYESRLFYEILFDRYLVKTPAVDTFLKTFISNLFDQKLLTLNVGQLIANESADFVVIRQIGVLEKKESGIKDIEELYNNKYQPLVGYNFTSYDYKYIYEYKLNKENSVIEKANIEIIEEVKNNVQVIVNYELKLVDL